jgi:hypothetical protein
LFIGENEQEGRWLPIDIVSLALALAADALKTAHKDPSLTSEATQRNERQREGRWFFTFLVSRLENCTYMNYRDTPRYPQP